MASRPSSAPHPVDQVPPFGKLTILGIQHVLAFYAGAVVVPLVIASGLGLDNRTLVHLINADLLTCGIATIIQSAGIGRFIGVKLPLIQGVTFTAVSPLIAIGAAATPPGADPTTGLATMYGSIIAVGLIVFLVAPFFAKLLRFFPPIVTGTLLTVMGTTLLSVSAGDIVAWADKATDDAAKAADLRGPRLRLRNNRNHCHHPAALQGLHGDPVRPPRPADHDRRRLRIGQDRLLGRG